MEIIDKILEKSRAEEQLGLTELTVNSCFSALSLFSSIHFPFLCAPTSIFFVFLTKSSRKRNGISNILYTFARRYPFCSRRVDAFFLKREIVETRTWEGSGIMT